MACIYEEPVSGWLLKVRRDCEEGEEEERGGHEERREEGKELDKVRKEEEEINKVERVSEHEGEEREEVSHEESLDMLGNVREAVLRHIFYGFLAGREL